MNLYLEKIRSGNSLSFSEAKTVGEWMLEDGSDSHAISEILIGLRKKKESTDEIEGFLAAIRSTTTPFPRSGETLIDVCGTGGDGINTFNVSTGVALILASLDIKVAKHGNRSVSSLSGSSDVLQALQIRMDTDIENVNKSLTKNNLSFLHAPAFYPVLAKLAPIRKSISTRTIFNALGPLLNPAPITHQLMGVYDLSLLETSILSMKARGLKRGLVVHGSDGLDELTLSGETHALKLEDDKITTLTLSPEDFGLKRSPLSEVRGGTPHENAQILIDIYRGERSSKRNLLVINAAVALSLVEGNENFKESVSKIESALDSGVTLKFVEMLKQSS